MRTFLFTFLFSAILGISTINGQITSEWSFIINNLTVDFTDETTGSPTFWLWDFGDGNTSPMQNPSHTYAVYGLYTTCLTVVDALGNADSTCMFINLLPPPPAFSKSFSDGMIPLGSTTTLTFTIDNSTSAVAANALDFTDIFPPGLVVASPSNASTTCTGGTLTAVPGNSNVTYTGGTVAAGATCTVTVDVEAESVGVLVNTTGDLTSSSGNSGGASATLEVTAPIPTMGEWGIIILFLLMIIIGSAYILKNKSSKTYLS